MTQYDQPLSGQIDLSNSGPQPQQFPRKMVPGESVSIPGNMFTREMQEEIMKHSVNGDSSGLYPMIFAEVNRQVDQMYNPNPNPQQPQTSQPVENSGMNVEQMKRLSEFIQTPQFVKAYASVISGQSTQPIAQPNPQPGMTQNNPALPIQPVDNTQQPTDNQEQDFFGKMFGKNEQPASEPATQQPQQPGQDQTNENRAAAEIVVQTCTKHGIDPNDFIKFTQSLDLDDFAILYNAYREQINTAQQPQPVQPVQQSQQPQQPWKPPVIPDIAESPSPQGPIRISPQIPGQQRGNLPTMWQ